ncbi:MAG: hypothetical protein Q8S20_18375 [Sulfuritalea sp.]|nr:hypothetical protein [Sulfuritalea sp.]
MNSRYLQVLGIPGFVGVGLLLFCASFYFSALAPAQIQLDSARSDARKLAATLRAPEPNVHVAIVEADASSTGLKPASDPIEIIRRLNAAAETAAITIDRSSYTISDKDGRRRIKVSLPTKGGYLPIRSYLREALTVGRSAQIDSLVLQRARATDQVLDADLKLSFELDAK